MLSVRGSNLLIPVVLIAACGGCDSEFDIVPAHGTVQLDGEPFTGGKIVLTPLNTGTGRVKPAFGDIQSDGTFVLTTLEAGDGACIGKHRVAIVPQRGAEEDEDSQVAYQSPSDYTLDVKQGQDNDFTVNVSRQEGWKVYVGD